LFQADGQLKQVLHQHEYALILKYSILFLFRFENKGMAFDLMNDDDQRLTLGTDFHPVSVLADMPLSDRFFPLCISTVSAENWAALAVCAGPVSNRRPTASTGKTTARDLDASNGNVPGISIPCVMPIG
jgi:hypothetical protein